MNCTSLTGLLDLSHTKVTYIGKSTFNGCTNLTGVIFPSSLKYIGDQEGGSVFKDCIDLQFVRVTSKNNDAAFELPDTLESIGYQAGWVYNDKVLEKTTVLKPDADELRRIFLMQLMNQSFNLSLMTKSLKQQIHIQISMFPITSHIRSVSMFLIYLKQMKMHLSK